MARRLDTYIPQELADQLQILCQVHAWTKKDAVAQAISLLIKWAAAQAPQATEDTPSTIGFRNECNSTG